MADYRDILSENEDPAGNENFLPFGEEEFPKTENSINPKTAETSFDRDALEGLKQIQSAKRVSHVNQLNKKLHQQLYSQKKTKKRRIKELFWIILAILILLLVCVFGYVVIRIRKSGNSVISTAVTIDQKTRDLRV